MTQFDDRERAFETKYARDQEMQFKIVARRNRLLGQWAAKKMGLTEAEADAYAKDVIRADFEEAGDEDVIRKVLGDLTSAGVEIDEAAIREALDHKTVEARRQLHGGAGLMPMAADEIESLIRDGIPDAQVEITDLAGDGDHYAARVVAESFRGLPRVHQHQRSTRRSAAGWAASSTRCSSHRGARLKEDIHDRRQRPHRRDRQARTTSSCS